VRMTSVEDFARAGLDLPSGAQAKSSREATHAVPQPVGPPSNWERHSPTDSVALQLIVPCSIRSRRPTRAEGAPERADRAGPASGKSPALWSRGEKMPKYPSALAIAAIHGRF